MSELKALRAELEIEKDARGYWHKIACAFGASLGFTYAVLIFIAVMWWLARK